MLRCSPSMRPITLRSAFSKDESDGPVLVVWLLSVMHHRLDRSTGKPVDPFDRGQIIVPVCTTGAADMRVGSDVNPAVN